ncbi:MAG: TonB-dependent receptor [Bacteroidota bacterium]|nr:MAG: TonB-dependent receptor [Bacteroidota bacterium]
MEIDLRAGYTANRVWNLYAELNNLSGSQYQRWYGYPQWGRQILLGAVYSFSQDNPVKRQ